MRKGSVPPGRTQVQWAPTKTESIIQAPSSSGISGHPNTSSDTPVPDSPPLQVHINYKADDSSGLPVALAHGYCRIVPEKDGEEALVVQVKLNVRYDKNKAWLELLHNKKGKRVIDIADMITPTMDGKFCVVLVPTLRLKYRLDFGVLAHTVNFQKAFNALQMALKQRQERAELEKMPSAGGTSSVAPEDQSAVMITKVISPVDQREVGLGELIDLSTEEELDANQDAIKDTDDQHDQHGLVGLDGFEQAVNMQSPIFETVSNHITALINQVLTHVTLDHEPMEPIIKGIESSLLVDWAHTGVLQEPNDPVKENVLSILHQVAAMKVNLVQRFHKQSKNVEDVFNGSVHAIAESTAVGSVGESTPDELVSLADDSRLQYLPKDILALRDHAIPPKRNMKNVPSLVNKASDLMKKDSRVARHASRTRSACSQPGPLDEDFDTPMGNAECMLGNCWAIIVVWIC